MKRGYFGNFLRRKREEISMNVQVIFFWNNVFRSEILLWLFDVPGPVCLRVKFSSGNSLP